MGPNGVHYSEVPLKEFSHSHSLVTIATKQHWVVGGSPISYNYFVYQSWRVDDGSFVRSRGKLLQIEITDFGQVHSYSCCLEGASGAHNYWEL